MGSAETPGSAETTRMSQPDTLAQLAAETEPCVKCGGSCLHGEVCGCFHSAIHACHTNPDYKRLPLVFDCKNCAGSGTVPLIPELWVPCEGWHGSKWIDEIPLRKDEYGRPFGVWERQLCAEVGCPGYTVLSGAEALLVLLEWAAAQGHRPVLWFSLGDGEPLWIAQLGEHREFWAEKPKPLDALASAVAQARVLKAKA